MREHKADLSITKIQKPDHSRTQNRHDITKLEKYKKLKMTEHKTGINITKIGKYKKNKLSTTSLMEHKTVMNITEKLSITLTTEHKTEYNYTLVNRTINMYKSNKRVRKLRTTHKKG